MDFPVTLNGSHGWLPITGTFINLRLSISISTPRILVVQLPGGRDPRSRFSHSWFPVV